MSANIGRLFVLCQNTIYFSFTELLGKQSHNPAVVHSGLPAIHKYLPPPDTPTLIQVVWSAFT